jgi:hypothetical protein
LGIANNGVVIGSCRNASNVSFAVTWSASAPADAPLELAPLTGLLGLDPDVSDKATGYNQDGAVMGVSINSSGAGTAVLWANGSGVATQVSTVGDNCLPIDMNDDSATTPTLVLNCPNANGTATPKFAQATGLLGTYVTTALALPAGASYCTVSGTNDALQAVGTCHTAAPDEPKAAYWSSFTSAPTLLSTLSGGARNFGEFINNQGHIIFTEQTGTGQYEAGFWDPSTSTVTMIPPLTGGTTDTVEALADNDTAVVNSEDGSQNVEAATWTSATGITALGFAGGGLASRIVDMSQNGGYAAGTAKDSSENNNAVIATLP